MEISFDELNELIAKKKMEAQQRGYDEGVEDTTPECQCKTCDRPQKVSWEEVKKEYKKWSDSHMFGEKHTEKYETAQWVYNVIYNR